MTAHHAKHHHHITSLPALLATFVLLVLLTVLTVFLSHYDLGKLDMVVTLAIAVVKAVLVALIFMQLLHDKLLNGLVILGALVFMALFLGIALFDSLQYRPQIDEFQFKNPPTVAAPAAATPAT